MLRPRLQRITSSGSYIPEIDGFRFLAISGVVLAHLVIAFHTNARRGLKLAGLEQAAAELLYRGTYGVELFFVISGFILALPFAKHFLSGEPAVRLGKYYLRRLTRLEPPYLLALCAFYLAAWRMGDGDLQGGPMASFLSRVFYAHGIVFGDTARLNGVTWSLEVEVQFYLLVPLLVHVFRLPAAVRRGLMLALIVGLPWVPWNSRALEISILNFFHYFVAGFLLADLYLTRIVPHPRAERANDLWSALLLVAMPLVPVVGVERPRLLALMICACYFCIFRSVTVRWILTRPWLCITGGMCYSIYLLHYPFIVQIDRLVYKLAPGLGFARGLLVLTAVALPILAVLCTTYFVLIERPCMDSRWPAKPWDFLRRARPPEPSAAARAPVEPVSSAGKNSPGR